MKTLGIGFVLDSLEAEKLLCEPRNAAIVKPYVDGRDLNRRPDSSASRFVIDFNEFSEVEARRWPECFKLLEERVLPERSTKDAKRYPRMVYEWWKFWNSRPNLRSAIHRLSRMIVVARVSSTLQPVWSSVDAIPSDQVVVIAYDDDGHFGVLSSSFHWWWAATRASTMRTDIRYTPTDCFETFAQPDLNEAVAILGGDLDIHRNALMLAREEGLTKTYNRVHNPDEHSDDVGRLREIHVALDHAVRDAYGWSDVNLAHDFYETKFGTRFTFAPGPRQEVLDRLLELNHKRYAEEVREGLHAKTKSKRSATRRPQALSLLDG